MATVTIPNAACACEPHAAPASRASWCGQLQLGTLSVPVKAYAAIASPPEEIVKGYPYQPDQYVVLSDTESTELQPLDEKTIRLKHFLDPAMVDLVLLAGRSLYLAPANPAACRAFAMVYRAMQRSGKWALGRVVLSNRWQIVVVRPENQVLLVHTLHHPAQRRALAGNGATDVEVSQKELRPVLRLITSADGEIPWDDYQDDWERRVTALADSRHKFKQTRQLATRILERVEMDHSPLKVVVGSEAGPIGQPWLTLLIDYYSRLVVGFCLGFEPPSYAVIMEALRHAILPKTYLKERYARVQGSWPCCGLPEKLVCDRGPDLTSKDLEEAAFQLGIELDFNPPRTPYLKGTVESFFDGLNDQLATSLPGRTFRNWADRADYKPDDGPFLSYEGLLEVVHIHLIDVYSNMKAKQAASVLETLDERIAVKILAGMRGRQAGEILTYVNPQKAARLSESLTKMQMPLQ